MNSIEEQYTKAWMNMVWLVIFLFVSYLVLFGCDNSFNNSQLYLKISVKSDCFYKLPKGYKILKDSNSETYAIGREVKYPYLGKQYTFLKMMNTPFYKLVSIYGTSNDAIIFKDSCQAKGFAKQYFESEEDFRNFKEVK